MDVLRTYFVDRAGRARSTKHEARDPPPRPLSAMDTDVPRPLTLDDLDSNLLAKCLEYLTLFDYPSCSSVSQAWREGCKHVFSMQLRWRGAVCVRQLDIPPAKDERPPTSQQARIARSSGMASFVSQDDARVVALVADPKHQSVRTFRCFGDDGEVVVEDPVREWPYTTICGGFPGSLVGYSNDGMMAYFPALTKAGISDGVRLISSQCWQNILQCGDQLFLLRKCYDWWTDRRLAADVLHIPTGGWLHLDISPFRDKLRLQLLDEDISPFPNAVEEGGGGTKIESSAVSATASHFVYRVCTASKHAVVGSLLLPDASKGKTTRAEAEWVDVVQDGLLTRSCVQRFAASHPLSQTIKARSCNEAHVGDELLLYDEATIPITLCLLNSFTGACHSVRLRSRGYPLEQGHLTSLTVSRPGGDAASAIACGSIAAYTDPRLLGPRFVLLWDLDTGINLAVIELVRPIHQPQEWPSWKSRMDVAVNVHRRILGRGCIWPAPCGYRSCSVPCGFSFSVSEYHCQLSILLSMWSAPQDAPASWRPLVAQPAGGLLFLINILE